MKFVRRRCLRNTVQLFLMMIFLGFLRTVFESFSDSEIYSKKHDIPDIPHIAVKDNENLVLNNQPENPELQLQEEEEEENNDSADVQIENLAHVPEHEKPSYRDKRDPTCTTLRLSPRIEPATIIVPFCEEPLEVLLEILQSIKANTWKRLVYEVVFLKGKCKTRIPLMNMEVAIENEYDEAIVARAGDEVGIMQGRRKAPFYTAADTLVFLDASYRLTPNWLRPLLEVIALNNKSIAAPIVETQDPHTGLYMVPFGESVTAFDWHLHPRAMPLGEASRSQLPKPYSSPMLPSSVFAIDRKFFLSLGTHDVGIKNWGPAQLELSLKTWLCGGNISVVPCSRVLLPHVASHTASDHDQDNPVGYRRVLDVWLSRDQRKSVFRRLPKLQWETPGSTVEQRSNRAKLQCKEMNYFLNGPGSDALKIFPVNEPPHFANGKIKNILETKYCIGADEKIGGMANIQNCNVNQQVWVLDWRKLLRTVDELLCVTAGEDPYNKSDIKIFLQECSVLETVPDGQLWRYDPETHQIQSGLNKKCLTKMDNYHLTLKECREEENKQQLWSFESVNRDLIARQYREF